MSNDREIDERDIRLWFMKTDLAQAQDTFNVVDGILQTREQYQPKRKRRSDAGTKRDEPDIASQDRKLFESTQG